MLERHLYVCTHNARDCRCGTTGTAVFSSLASIFSTPESTSSSSASTSAPSTPTVARVQVQEIGHVGGHNYAVNVLDFPSGDMYGSVLPSNVDAFARALAVTTAPLGVEPEHDSSASRSIEDTKLLLSLWRGRLGMSSEEQVASAADLKSRIDNADNDTSPISTATLKPLARGTSPASLVPLVFETHEGERISLEAEEGLSVMEVAKAAGVPSIEGTCGGKLEVCLLRFSTKNIND